MSSPLPSATTAATPGHRAARSIVHSRLAPSGGATKIERWIRRVGAKSREKKIQLRVNSSLAIFLEEERAEVFDALSRRYKMKIEIQDDPRLHREDFKVVSLSSFRDLVQELA